MKSIFGEGLVDGNREYCCNLRKYHNYAYQETRESDFRCMNLSLSDFTPET